MEEELKKAYERGYKDALDKSIEILRNKLYVSNDILCLFSRWVVDDVEFLKES